jgi:hypothetical protein
VQFALCSVVMQFRAEGGLYLCGRSGECDAVAAACYAFDVKAARCQPTLGCGDVLIGDTEASGEGLRGKPVVIER